jgi:hypothetical protein
MSSEPHSQESITLDWAKLYAGKSLLSPAQIPELRAAMDEDLKHKFRNWLPPELKGAFDSPAEHNSDTEKLGEQFNRFIVFEAETMGPALLLSDAVLLRMIEWNSGRPDGIHYLQQMTQAMVRGAKVRQGQAKADAVSPHLYRFKVAAKEELKALQQKLRADSAANTRSGWLRIEAMLHESPDTFPRLYQNLSSLEAFCVNNPASCNGFVLGTIKPAGFFFEWGGWSSNRDPEDYRQKVSESKRI